jgi:hypothetical protein
MAAISHVFTIDYVAEMLGVAETLIDELCIGLEPKDGYLWVYGPGDQQTQAFTPCGIECLRQLIVDEQRRL